MVRDVIITNWDRKEKERRFALSYERIMRKEQFSFF